MSKFWILKDNELIETDSPTWAKWFENINSPGRVTKKTKIGKRFLVSTVFLGLDHGIDPKRPELWETIVFDEDGIDGELYQTRYSSLQEAREGHEKACNIARRQLIKGVYMQYILPIICLFLAIGAFLMSYHYYHAAEYFDACLSGALGGSMWASACCTAMLRR